MYYYTQIFLRDMITSGIYFSLKSKSYISKDRREATIFFPIITLANISLILMLILLLNLKKIVHVYKASHIYPLFIIDQGEYVKENHSN